MTNAEDSDFTSNWQIPVERDVTRSPKGDYQLVQPMPDGPADQRVLFERIDTGANSLRCGPCCRKVLFGQKTEQPFQVAEGSA